MRDVNTISMTIIEQLTKKAQDLEESIDTLIALYCQERMVYRLSISSYQDQFWLAGDSLLFAVTEGFIKPPKNTKLAAKPVAYQIDIIKQAFKEICSMEGQEDGIEFLWDEVTISSENDGLFIKIPAILAHLKTYITLQVNFREHTPVAFKTMAYPTLLQTASPILIIEAPEHVIASKFVEIYKTPTLDTTINAIQTIFALINTQTIEGRVLQECIATLFDQQRLTIKKDHAFFMRQYLQQATSEIVTRQVQKFLSPVYDVILHEEEFFKHWDCKQLKWH